MEGQALIEAVNAGGNVGLLMMGLSLMRLHVRVAKIELRYELKQEAAHEAAKSDKH